MSLHLTHLRKVVCCATDRGLQGNPKLATGESDLCPLPRLPPNLRHCPVAVPNKISMTGDQGTGRHAFQAGNSHPRADSNTNPPACQHGITSSRRQSDTRWPTGSSVDIALPIMRATLKPASALHPVPISTASGFRQRDVAFLKSLDCGQKSDQRNTPLRPEATRGWDSWDPPGQRASQTVVCPCPAHRLESPAIGPGLKITDRGSVAVPHQAQDRFPMPGCRCLSWMWEEVGRGTAVSFETTSRSSHLQGFHPMQRLRCFQERSCSPS
ncbi:hypothetical protein N658DRAFT_4853 [Parathielavia hyrcaniae]|uniref:Uncharacterized protein n=1 Tax=Parathielavia hyrcaniae TaxID=113614 RepID=A0AAN6QEM3_9PEZI|nr:hypothetical protein N658DRAFT_4853 [Parathielavia hyrcaniae]